MTDTAIRSRTGHLEAHNANNDTFNAVLYEADGTQAPFGDTQLLIDIAGSALERYWPTGEPEDIPNRTEGNTVAIGEINFDDSVTFTRNGEPVDNATIATAITAFMRDAVRHA